VDAAGHEPASDRPGPDREVSPDREVNPDRKVSSDAFPAPVPDDCLNDVSAGEHTFTCEGMKVNVSVPAACLLSACGLVVDIHGACMTGADEDSHTSLRALGQQHGYVVVQPTAPDHPAICAGGGDWDKSGADDGAVFKVLQRVSTAWHVDGRRIHFTGFSQGGFATWRFICSHADILASAAPAAAGASAYGIKSCLFSGTDTPSQPIDILFLAGRKDTVVPYTWMAAERDAVIAAWGLGGAQVMGSDEEHTRTRYGGGQGVVLETLEHDYMTDPAGPLGINHGHCVPGSTAATGSFWDALKCKPPNAFVWGEEVMKFFVAHPKRPAP
jgi:dienelactone hydrolase